MSLDERQANSKNLRHLIKGNIGIYLYGKANRQRFRAKHTYLKNGQHSFAYKILIIMKKHKKWPDKRKRTPKRKNGPTKEKEPQKEKRTNKSV
ncbi:MAG: hypothetical protein MJ107_06740 [Lachnospiraceae bacterium]|nr:hypothetical protein [Lachnospiraceae bacterium]